MLVHITGDDLVRVSSRTFTKIIMAVDLHVFWFHTITISSQDYLEAK